MVRVDAARRGEDHLPDAGAKRLPEDEAVENRLDAGPA
jgi:hypothetical protein